MKLVIIVASGLRTSLIIQELIKRRKRIPSDVWAFMDIRSDRLEYNQYLINGIHYMAIMTIIIYTLTGLMSAILVNYFGDVLPVTRQVSKPVCYACHSKLGLLDYLINKPCPGCGRKRKKRWFFLLFLFPVLYVTMAYLQFYRFQPVLLDWLLIIFMMIIIIIDMEYKVILNEVVIVGLVICGTAGYLLHGFMDTLMGGAVGFLIMLILYYLGKVFIKGMNKLRGTDISEDALGFGDVNLGCLLGLLLGISGIPVGLLIGILIGGSTSAVFLIYQILQRQYTAFHALPYAPFMILGSLILFYFPG